VNPQNRPVCGRGKAAFAPRYVKAALAPRYVWVGMALAGTLAVAARGDDGPGLRIKGESPPNQVVLKSVPGGTFFVAKSLKERYDRALAEVQRLKGDLDADRVSGADAMEELESLQGELEKLREEIERAKALVPTGKIHRQSETTTYELGPERLLVITADNITLKGWDGPQVKCVLEKTVLAVDDKPVDEQLKGLKLAHRHGPAPEIVGRTPAEREAEEKAFLASPNGRKLDEKGHAARQRLLRQIGESFEIYGGFQGKDIDTIEIEGLTHEQGNRWVSIDLAAPGGGGYFAGEWQRRAALTVYVPSCKAVAVRGCRENLDVRGVRTSLVLTSGGSHDCDYDGKFQVRDVRGSLTVENAPLDLVEAVHGNVLIRSTTEMVNGSTHFEKGQRTINAAAPRVLTCRKIDGDLTAWFTRSSLELGSIAGRIDVKNEFGDTTLVVGRGLARAAHRVLSEAGRIEAHVMPGALEQLPMVALTNCGSVRTNADQKALHNVNFTVGRDPAGVSRDWHGLISGPDSPDGLEFMERIDRLAAALEGKDRPPGLDLISRGGNLRVIFEPGR
jgi:hypothetical protein